ncbi:hypothetical protein HXV90_09195 [Lysinibacillus sp. JK80]|uniref:phBC6A51 family helix-turn-helix protein n=1 Tax=Lysinibacillus sp. JK80 TaxID=2749809 RepID=UPI0022B9AD86|nr:phBC6A51 family helix-turn-helix protein [Lysinibacillus sp. JK80]WBF56020.1 hypothetical protein HXV90_09195 [Lysinibacillus sp. JK80]
MEHNKFTEGQMIAISILSTPDRNGLTLAEIAEKSGVPYWTLARWRKNEIFMKEVLKLNPLYYEKSLSNVQLEVIDLLSEPKYKRLTQKEIAEKMNISDSTIGYWLKNDLFNSELKKRTDEKMISNPINEKFLMYNLKLFNC